MRALVGLPRLTQASRPTPGVRPEASWVSSGEGWRPLPGNCSHEMQKNSPRPIPLESTASSRSEGE